MNLIRKFTSGARLMFNHSLFLFLNSMIQLLELTCLLRLGPMLLLNGRHALITIACNLVLITFIVMTYDYNALTCPYLCSGLWDMGLFIILLPFNLNQWYIS